ncbi:divalent metal cation (Fe/Co/Zn/Cd) transporter [Paraburkholderia bannensis]|uniref:Divalent metal cation (Fe/Co/Zn/Cd) transporter n=1 Tax=Paraburkholderia bannensis TaxID=765414 RepID=A0A7W9WSS2_9BURK|nr:MULTISPECIES: cation transporter [Paraburkholderia]MBB3257599.1 divalent metal cation (Fe/Co/Zn/Cd) transporter [Paraburkholderia sp. WP4_3_2]MBB6102612.1 divalent metal cation (Fe/Co/Zn/Cd) transporter [Paraburkholderia bannensis]
MNALKRASLVTLLVNLVLMMFQMLAGWSSGSHAMFADGAHNLMDVATDGLVAAAIFWVDGNPNGRRKHLLPVVSSFASLMVMAVGAEFLLMSVFAPAVPGDDAQRHITLFPLVVAIASCLAKAALYGYLRWTAAHAEQHGHTNHAGVLRVSARHTVADSVSSCIAAIGVTGMLAGSPLFDTSATALIGCLIFLFGFMQKENPAWILLSRGIRSIRLGPRAAQPGLAPPALAAPLTAAGAAPLNARRR